MLYLNLFLIATFAVMLNDMTDAMATMTKPIKKWLNINKETTIKPFQCSLCLSFWLNVIYLLITSQMGLYALFATMLFAVITPQILNVITLITDFIDTLINKAKNALY